MKFTIEIDTEPEEARRFLGLPDLEPMQQRLLDQAEEQIARNMKLMDADALMKMIIPATTQGVEQIQGLFQNALKSVRDRAERRKGGDE